MPVAQGSVFDVLSRSMQHATSLVSTLGQLAVAEVAAGAGNIVKGVAALFAGLGIGMIGLLFMLHAAVAYLVQRGWSEAAAYAMVGGAGIVLSLVAILTGALLLKRASPVPRRTIREMRALLGAGDVVS